MREGFCNNPSRIGAVEKALLKEKLPVAHPPPLPVLPSSCRKGPAKRDETPSSSRVGALARRIEGALLRQAEDRPFDTPPSAATQGEVDMAACKTRRTRPFKCQLFQQPPPRSRLISPLIDEAAGLHVAHRVVDNARRHEFEDRPYHHRSPHSVRHGGAEPLAL